jgi:hypothetical protein
MARSNFTQLEKISVRHHHAAGDSDESPARSRFLWVVPTAVAAATLANVVFYFVLTQWLEEPLLIANQFPPPPLAPMGVGEVVLLSIIFSLGATLVYVFASAVSKRMEELDGRQQ